MTARRKYTPRPYAAQAGVFLAEHDRCNLWAGMGMGKTSIVETVLEAAYNLAGETEPTLVLAPKRVAADTWTDEAAKWQHLAGLDICPIVGTPSERFRALRRDVPVHTINYENLPWLVDQVGNNWPWRRVIADESTRLKGFRTRQGGQRAQALAQVAHTKVDRWVNLTGRPAPNGVRDLWGQNWFVDAGVRLGRTFSSFEERWFRPVRNDEGYYSWFPHDHSQREIQHALRDVSLTLDPKDWFDLKDPIVTDIEVKLPPKAMAQYKQMEKEFFLSVAGQDIEAFNAASKSMKCLQIASGFVHIDTKLKQWAPLHDAKLEALESIVNEAAGMPVLCAYQWVPDRERILKAFPGSVDLATKEGLAAFKTGKVALGIAHPQSLGHGVDGLQYVTNILAFYSDWWDMDPHDQIIERVGPVRQMQAGLDRNVFVYHILAKGTVDYLLKARHETKRSVQDLVLDAMKRGIDG